MGTLTIKTRSLSTQAEYVNAESGLTINVNYNEDVTTNTLKSINGSIYKTDGMTYAGNFSGQPQGDEVEYSVSGVKSKDMAKVFAAIKDIEELIKGEKNNGEE
jgi:hypothetical protein